MTQRWAYDITRLRSYSQGSYMKNDFASKRTSHNIIENRAKSRAEMAVCSIHRQRTIFTEVWLKGTV
jgi:hypothetical protein